MELMPERSIFEFDIWFDRINQGQLDELLWILTFGENNLEGVKWHKIGHGKPLGLGSVKIEVCSIKKREVTVSNGRLKRIVPPAPLPDAFPAANPFRGQGYSDLEKIAETRYSNIHYPLGDGGPAARDKRCASYQWFIGNRQMKGTGVQPVISKVLPLIRDGAGTADLSLPKYEKV